ncbi:hypothetical protein BCR44DRAFT_1035545 [Catenaria anguillulae PL171]|uniref:Uncharacterized protein n=1 Tax=Catenaria anguillulae PL171 TaxID=765915 RepID=A0A1Y2HWN1_9FUNG|nr:hypothetical protein BCR44DRAFT_1035545 [Catenaria anguillulae PL171]
MVADAPHVSMAARSAPAPVAPNEPVPALAEVIFEADPFKTVVHPTTGAAEPPMPKLVDDAAVPAPTPAATQVKNEAEIEVEVESRPPPPSRNRTRLSALALNPCPVLNVSRTTLSNPKVTRLQSALACSRTLTSHPPRATRRWTFARKLMRRSTCLSMFRMSKKRPPLPLPRRRPTSRIRPWPPPRPCTLPLSSPAPPTSRLRWTQFLSIPLLQPWTTVCTHKMTTPTAPLRIIPVTRLWSPLPRVARLPSWAGWLAPSAASAATRRPSCRPRTLSLWCPRISRSRPNTSRTARHLLPRRITLPSRSALRACPRSRLAMSRSSRTLPTTARSAPCTPTSRWPQRPWAANRLACVAASMRL